MKSTIINSILGIGITIGIPVAAVKYKKPVQTQRFDTNKKQVSTNLFNRFMRKIEYYSQQNEVRVGGIVGIVAMVGLGSMTWYKHWWPFGTSMHMSPPQKPTIENSETTITDNSDDEQSSSESNDQQEVDHSNDTESSRVIIEDQEQSQEQEVPETEQQVKEVDTSIEQKIANEIAEKEKKIAAIDQEIQKIKADQQSKIKQEKKTRTPRSYARWADKVNVDPNIPDKQKKQLSKEEAIQTLVQADKTDEDPAFVVQALNTLFQGVTDTKDLDFMMLRLADGKSFDCVIKSIGNKYKIGCREDSTFYVL